MGVNINRVTLVGRLTKDPELRHTSSGAAVTNLNLATNSYSHASSTGERKEFTEFHNVVVYDTGARKLAQWTAASATKGSMVFVEGRLQTRSWETSDGQKRRTTEVVAVECQVLTKTTEGQQQTAVAAALGDGLERAPDA